MLLSRFSNCTKNGSNIILMFHVAISQKRSKKLCFLQTTLNVVTFYPSLKCEEHWHMLFSSDKKEILCENNKKLYSYSLSHKIKRNEILD